MPDKKVARFQGYEVVWDGPGIYILHRIFFTTEKSWERIREISMLELWMAQSHQPQYLEIDDVYEAK